MSRVYVSLEDCICGSRVFHISSKKIFHTYEDWHHCWTYKYVNDMSEKSSKKGVVVVISRLINDAAL